MHWVPTPVEGEVLVYRVIQVCKQWEDTNQFKDCGEHWPYSKAVALETLNKENDQLYKPEGIPVVFKEILISYSKRAD